MVDAILVSKKVKWNYTSIFGKKGKILIISTYWCLFVKNPKINIPPWLQFRH